MGGIKFLEIIPYSESNPPIAFIYRYRVAKAFGVINNFNISPSKVFRRDAVRPSSDKATAAATLIYCVYIVQSTVGDNVTGIRSLLMTCKGRLKATSGAAPYIRTHDGYNTPKTSLRFCHTSQDSHRRDLK